MGESRKGGGVQGYDGEGGTAWCTCKIVQEGLWVQQLKARHRVEPATRLVDALRNEVGGEGFLEVLFVLEGVVLLRGSG